MFEKAHHGYVDNNWVEEHRQMQEDKCYERVRN